MLKRRSDLPLERNGLSRFLPWLIAFMVYLAALAMAGTLVLDAMAERWSRGANGTLTVQIPPLSDEAGGTADAERVQEALDVLRAAPEVESAEPLDDARLRALLEPWLGSGADAGELPLPRLIDVRLKPGVRADISRLSRSLVEAVPGAVLDDHRVWLERLVRLVQSVEALATAVLVLIGLATVGTVIFTTRTGLAIHHEAIEVLHLTGARDSYIAAQFAYRALMLGLKGGIIGLVLVVPTLMGLGELAARMEQGLLPDFTLAPVHWAVLACLPVAVAAIAMATARVTVMRTLGKML